MILRNSDYASLAQYIKADNHPVIIYGSGMIGRIVVPFFIRKYNLYDNLLYYVDMDAVKQGSAITIDGHNYVVRDPSILTKATKDTVVLITNSKFTPIVKYLDGFENLDEARGYIIPIMQIYTHENDEHTQITGITNEPIIPKVIHYCWFSKKTLPKSLAACIESWRKMCPDYEIKQWDESNYDVNKYLYTREAYANGRFGFVTDVARLDILYENGGVYFDTDVTLIKNIDDLLYQKAFIGVEKWGNINSGGGCGAIKHHQMIKNMLEYRKDVHFVNEDGSLNIETNGLYETGVFIEHGMRVDNTLQTVNDVTVYPSSVFHPYDYMSCNTDLKIDTCGIHHFSGGWMDEADYTNRANTQGQYRQMLERMNKR